MNRLLVTIAMCFSQNFVYLFLPTILVCATVSTAGAQKQTPGFQTDSSAIVSIAQQLLDAIGKGDTVIWKKYMHADCLIMAEDGMLKRKQDLLDELKPLPDGYLGNIKVTNPVVVNQDNTFILSFIADEHLELYGQTIHTSYAETDTYVKNETGWQLLASEIFELPSDPVIMKVRDDILQSYTGTYHLADGVEYKVSFENGKLVAQRTGRPVVELLPETESVFFVKGQRGRKIFVKDTSGTIVKMMDRRSGNDLVWVKVR